MSHGFFAYPDQAAFNRVLPKSKIHEHAKPSARVKDLFTSQIQQITWAYKLSPETINITARGDVQEIQIFKITCKTENLSEEALRCIDEAIQFPVFFEVTAGNQVQTKASLKRQNESIPGKWIVETYFESPWLPHTTSRSPLPVALDLENLYANMLRTLMPYPARPGESLRDQVARHISIRSKQKEAKKIENHLLKEKQYNRRIAINDELRILRQELQILQHLEEKTNE